MLHKCKQCGSFVAEFVEKFFAVLVRGANSIKDIIARLSAETETPILGKGAGPRQIWHRIGGED